MCAAVVAASDAPFVELQAEGWPGSAWSWYCAGHLRQDVELRDCQLCRFIFPLRSPLFQLSLVGPVPHVWQHTVRLGLSASYRENSVDGVMQVEQRNTAGSHFLPGTTFPASGPVLPSHKGTIPATPYAASTSCTGRGVRWSGMLPHGVGAFAVHKLSQKKNRH